MADTTSIPRTLVATTDPVAIRGGIPLSRDIGNLDKFGFSKGVTLFDKEIHAGVFKVSSRAAFELEAGLAGPNHAFRMDLEGAYDPNEDRLTLHVSQDEFESGMIIGAVVSGELSLQVSHQWVRHVGHWYQPRYERYWKDALNKLWRKDFDLLPILAGIVLQIGSSIPGLNKIVAFIPRDVLDGMRDHKNDIMGSGGSVTLSPHIVGVLDLVQVAEALGGTAVEVVQPELTPVVEYAEEIEKVEEDVGPTVKAGPIFGVQFPTHVQLTGLTASQGGGEPVAFGTVDYVGEELRGTDPTGAFPADPDRVGVHVTHRNGIDITIGWTTKVTYKKLFNEGRSVKVNCLEEVGIDPTADSTEFTYRVDNRVGASGDDDVEIVFVGQS